METVRTKKGKLPPDLMARVDACAFLFNADRPEKIRSIMADRGVTEQEAGRIYTIGAMKFCIALGRASTFAEALETLEMEQGGARADPLSRTASADDMARVIARYKRINDKEPMRVNRVDAVRMAWARMDNQPLTEYAQPSNWQTVDGALKEKKRSHPLNVGKVLGCLYTDMEYRQEHSDPIYSAHNAVIQRNLKAFFKDYKSRLSRTVKKRLADLIEYINKKSGGDAAKAEKAIKDLTLRKGKESPETSKLAKFADNLHYGFPHKDAVSCPEFIELLTNYSDD
jgi:hypothetical protein